MTASRFDPQPLSSKMNTRPFSQTGLFRQTTECGFTLEFICDMIITYSHIFHLYDNSANKTKAFNLKVNCKKLMLVFVHHVNTECTWIQSDLHFDISWNSIFELVQLNEPLKKNLQKYIPTWFKLSYFLHLSPFPLLLLCTQQPPCFMSSSMKSMKI